MNLEKMEELANNTEFISQLSEWLYTWFSEQYYYEKEKILKNWKSKYYIPDVLIDSVINLFYDMKFNWKV